jgi:hypothetical protein
MQHPSITRVAASIAAGFAALALSASIAAAQGSTPPVPPVQKSAAGSVEQTPACTVKLAVDSVPASATPVVLDATLSGAIGDSVSASLPSASSITVVSVGAAAAGGANALQLTLNTSAAKPGEWPLALKGKTGECAGKVKVVPGGQ